MFQYNIWGAKIHSGIQYYNIKKEKMRYIRIKYNCINIISKDSIIIKLQVYLCQHKTQL